MFPIWAVPFASIGINLGLLGLRKIVPKLPAFTVPIINLGLGAGIGLIEAHGIPTGIDPTNVLATSGLAAITHNIIKNAVRRDSFAQPSRIVPE